MGSATNSGLDNTCSQNGTGGALREKRGLGKKNIPIATSESGIFASLPGGDCFRGGRTDRYSLEPHANDGITSADAAKTDIHSAHLQLLYILHGTPFKCCTVHCLPRFIRHTGVLGHSHHAVQ